MGREIKVVWKVYGRGNLTAFSLHCAVCTAVVSVGTCAVTNVSKKLLQYYSGQKNRDQHPIWNTTSCRLPATVY
jgi:hypothetical protein